MDDMEDEAEDYLTLIMNAYQTDWRPSPVILPRTISIIGQIEAKLADDPFRPLRRLVDSAFRYLWKDGQKGSAMELTIWWLERERAERLDGPQKLRYARFVRAHGPEGFLALEAALTGAADNPLAYAAAIIRSKEQ